MRAKKLTKRQLKVMIRSQHRSLMREAGKDYLSKTHPGSARGEERDPELDYTDEDDEGLEEARGRYINEVEYAGDRDPVARFGTELRAAWNAAMGHGAMGAELMEEIEMFLEAEGYAGY